MLGRYELITQIGQGGMAEVQLALQRGPAGFEKLVVVKLVHENLASQRDFVEMLLDEARVAALVKHPNVVDIYDLGEAEGRFFIAMEYLEGEPLLAVLRAGREGKRLDILSTARLISDTAEGLDAAHELRTMGGDPLGLVHHDVSLGNIVVLYTGQVKLVDFGVAKATQSVSSRSRVQGKFSYMAPEKLRGGAGDRRSDIWSLGCVLWEALTLKRLFKGGNDADTMRQVLESEIPPPSQINGDVPAAFDPIVLRALERDPDKRYPTAKKMSADLEEVLRKLGYGGRNDAIAKYMQTTFAAHITARKKLLQEVSLKGRASADILEAAFNDPVAGRGNPSVTGDFSVRFKRPSGELQAEGTPSRRSDTSGPAIARGSVDGVPAVSPSGSQAAQPSPPEQTMLDAPTVSPQRRKHLAIAVGGAVVLLVLVLVIATSGGDGEGSERAGPPIGSDHAIAPGSADHASAGSAPGSAELTQVGSAASDAAGSGARGSDAEASAQGSNAIDPDEIDITADSEDAADPAEGSAKQVGARRIRPRPTQERVNAAALHKQGVQAYVRGDNRAALAAFKRAQHANPGFAPTWRNLGLVHEKLGDRGAAKAAYRRYLTIAPKASDAAKIRERMAEL